MIMPRNYIMMLSFGVELDSYHETGQYNLRTADRTEKKMQTERYKMQTRDKMQTGINMGYLCFRATQYSIYCNAI